MNGGFLDYLRGCKVVATCAPNHPDFVTALEERYADFLRNEKGLAELSLKVYLPVATDLLHHLEEDCRITAVRHPDAHRATRRGRPLAIPARESPRNPAGRPQRDPAFLAWAGASSAA